MPERKISLCLFALFCFVNAYFFQGGNWGQNARFDTTRAIVEKGNIEISGYQNTRDVSIINGKTYINKPLGTSLLGVPVYFLLFNMERKASINPDHPLVIAANAHVLAFFTSGLPAAALTVLLFCYFLRTGLTSGDSSLLAAGFGFGSLVLPYSGAMMSHNVTACLLFASLFLISKPRDQVSTWSVMWSGVLAGYASFCDYLAAPIPAFLFGYQLWKFRSLRRSLLFLVGPVATAILALALQYRFFGSILALPYDYQNRGFSDPNLLFGMFEWPYPIRFFWLTIHPFRGILYCCPLFILPLLGIFTKNGNRQVEPLFCLAIFLFFFVANASFNGWHGGTSFGPRYLIPGLPFLYTLSALSFPRYRILAYILMVVSGMLMLCVSAVGITIPLETPYDFNPLSFIFSHLWGQEVSVSTMGIHEIRPATDPFDFWNSYNLGESAGLRGFVSLIPVVFAIAAFYIFNRTFRGAGLRARPVNEQ